MARAGASRTLTFRDAAGFQRWNRYAFREEGFRRVIALYSPWQLMYLKSALEDRLVLLTLPFVLGAATVCSMR
jgi:hypothetical protein